MPLRFYLYDVITQKMDKEKDLTLVDYGVGSQLIIPTSYLSSLNLHQFISVYVNRI